MQREIIIFDFETNGFKDASVLSLSAIKALIVGDRIELIDKFDRYYYNTPGEPDNYFALRVNNLSENAIRKYRGKADYPEHFVDDYHSFIEFCGHAGHFIAHNISFDKNFLCFECSTAFCTFHEATKMKIGKNNKLSDLAAHYKIEAISENLHSSMYDVEVLFEIIKKMYQEKNPNLLKFLDETPLSRKEQKYLSSERNTYLKAKKELKARHTSL